MSYLIIAYLQTYSKLQGGSKQNTPADIMQFLRNRLADFKNSWSCLILTLLRIEQYARYPPHLNYTTTLPCKTLTMKITIFIVMLVLKSEENITCYQYKTLWKQFEPSCISVKHF